MKSDSDLVVAMVMASVNSPADAGAPTLQRGFVQEIGADGMLLVKAADGHAFWCEVLLTANARADTFLPNTPVLVLPPQQGHGGICLGAIGNLAAPPRQVTLECADRLTLKCGEASIDLRADGKVMIRGEDVLVRAKGTKRIRAGTVAIN